MATHKFAAGDHVTFLPGQFDSNVTRGVYTIVRVLPVTDRGCQYRVKNVEDRHERVIDEVQLCRAISKKGSGWPVTTP
jgi:hypothetical protein